MRIQQHGSEIQAAENLRVLTGAAEYGRPEIQEIIKVELELRLFRHS